MWLTGWAVAAVLFAAGGAPAAAQTLTTGAIAGVVRDATGVPLYDVLVTVTQEATGRQYHLRSSRSGRFEARLLAPGEYRLLFERLGFRPTTVAGVVVAAADRRALSVELSAAEGPVEAAPAMMAGTATSATAASSWLLGWLGGRLPQDAAALDGVGLLHTRYGLRGEVEALPITLSKPVVDGVPTMTRLSAASALALLQSFPLSSFGFADVRTLSPDVEWPGSAGALIAAQTLTAGGAGQVAGLGDFGGDAFATGGDVASFTEYRVGGRFASRIGGDTALVVLGVDAARSDTPMEPLWDAATAQAVSTAAAQHGIDLARYTEPGSLRRERIAGYGHVGYRLSGDHELTVRGRFTQMPRLELDPLDAGSLFGPAFSASELLASVSLASQVGEQGLNEATVSLELAGTEREPDAEGLAGAAGVRTVLADPGVAFGSPIRAAAEADHRSIFMRDAYHLASGSHQLKLGASLALHHYRNVYDSQGRTEYIFENAGALASARGLYRAEGANISPQEFDVREFRVFAQDSWHVFPGVEALVGLRLKLTGLEMGTSSPNTNWLLLTGLESDSLEDRFTVFEPTFGLNWSLGGGWMFSAAAEVGSDAIAPGLLAEQRGHTGSHLTYSAVTTFTAYPGVPNDIVAPGVGARLSMLGPGFRPPRTARAGGVLSGALGPIGVSVGFNHRKTDYLPRRRDLNLPVDGLARDQHGRPIFGGFSKQGSLLVARPRQNRRFDGFDAVYGIEAIGESRYTGLTLAVDHSASELLRLFGSYTYSSATDDWIGGGSADPDLQVSPFPQSDLELSAWDDGTADLDVPHRAAVAAQVSAPGRFAPSLAVLYRYQSGYPFTPGFRDGVDVNADGSGRNDPAFVDQALAGSLIQEWSCLGESVGRFAVRNSCRAPAFSALDARLSLDLDLGTARARFVIDALNLVSSEVGLVDSALFLIDPDQDIQTDGATGRVTLPLVPNPGFGELLVRVRAQRVLRLGVRVSY